MTTPSEQQLSERQQMAVVYLSMFAADDWLQARDVAEAAGYGPDGRHFAQALVQMPAIVVSRMERATEPDAYQLTVDGWALASELRGHPIEYMTRAEREAEFDAIFA